MRDYLRKFCRKQKSFEQNWLYGPNIATVFLVVSRTCFRVFLAQPSILLGNFCPSPQVIYMFFLTSLMTMGFFEPFSPLQCFLKRTAVLALTAPGATFPFALRISFMWHVNCCHLRRSFDLQLHFRELESRQLVRTVREWLRDLFYVNAAKARLSILVS